MPAMVYPLLLAAAFWVVVLILSALDSRRRAEREALEAPTEDVSAVLTDALQETRHLQETIKAAIKEILESGKTAAEKRERVDAS